MAVRLAAVSLTWLYDADAQQVGGAVGHSAPAVVVVPPPQDGGALVLPGFATSRPRHRQAEVGVGVGAVDRGAGAQAQQLLPPLQRSLPREGHQVFELPRLLAVGVRARRHESPGDGGGDAGVVARFDQAEEVKGVSKGHGGRARRCRHHEGGFWMENKQREEVNICFG